LSRAVIVPIFAEGEHLGAT